MSKIDNKKKKNNNKKSKFIKKITSQIKLIQKKNKKESNKKKNNKKAILKSKKNNQNKITYKDLTISQIENELKRETYKSKYKNVLMTTIYSLIIIAAAAALIATLIMPVFQISGSSMAPELNNGDLVVSIKTKNLGSGDIIAFYHGNKILVKRIIASAGQWVVIDSEGNVYVDGILLDESYVDKKVLGDCDIKFPYQVPEESWFVLADNRSDFTDSRNNEIGNIKEEDIIGKILFKLWDANK